MPNLVTLRPKPGDVVERVYHVECELASDASSVVLGAVVPATGKRYLLRCWLNQGGAAPAAAIQHFVRIANLVQLFSQPGIVEVFGIGQTNGLFYEVTEWLEGTSLKRFLERRGALPVRDALALLLPCLEALAAAHAAGIVHGDLRPGNVFICHSTRFEAERARLLNFHHGSWPEKPVVLAKRLSEDVAVAQFLSPEELQGGPADARSDVYAVGVMLYVMLAERSPFAADNLNELAVEILDGQWTALSERVTGVSPALEQLIERAMASDPSERFQTMGELLAQLARVEGYANEALAKHAPNSPQYTWIKPASDYQLTSLFDLPALSEEQLAGERRVTRNRRILHTCVAVSFAVMFATILYRLYEPLSVDAPGAASRAGVSGPRDGSELSELTAANQLPALDHPLPNAAAPLDSGGAARAEPSTGLSRRKLASATAPEGRTSAVPGGQRAVQTASTAPLQAPPAAPPQAAPASIAKSAPEPAPTARALDVQAAPLSASPAASPASLPSVPSQPPGRSRNDALDRMRIE